MKRLLRISFDTLTTSMIPIIIWILLGIIVNKEIANVFTITYPIQFITLIVLTIFGTGANINATKNKKEYLVDTNIILGIIMGFIITFILIINIDKYLRFMNIENVEVYRNFCIYAIILMYLQLIIQLISQKLYYKNETKKSNRITLIFNLINLLLILLTSAIIKNEIYAILITIVIDLIVVIVISIANIKQFKTSFELLTNIKYASNIVLDKIGLFITYFIGFKISLEFGTMYLVAINFTTLITDAQWDMSYAIKTVATIDASENKLYYRKSLIDAYKLMALLLTSCTLMGITLYFYYKPELWIFLVMMFVEFADFMLRPKVWIKQQYCQVNYSVKINNSNEIITNLIRIITAFIPTPFCTYIGEILSILYQVIIYNFVFRKKYYIENELLKMKK